MKYPKVMKEKALECSVGTLGSVTPKYEISYTLRFRGTGRGTSDNQIYPGI